METENKLKVLICGGGNGAHCMAGLSSSNPDIETCILTLFADEAEPRIVQDSPNRWLNYDHRKSDGLSSEIKLKQAYACHKRTQIGNNKCWRTVL